MEMLLTGALVSAQTALEWGLVNRVVPGDALDTAIRQFSDVIVARSARRFGSASRRSMRRSNSRSQRPTMRPAK